MHKKSAKRHEDRCFYNPQVRACLSCGNFKTDYETVYVRPQGDQNYGDADYEERYYYCEATDKVFAKSKYYKKDNEQEFQHHCKYWIPKEE